MTTKFSSAQRGVTLIELMVAMAIGLMIIAAVGYVYLQGRQGYTAQDNLSRLQEDARFITEVITRDIRNSRYTGCQRVEDLPGGSAFGENVSLRFVGIHPWFSPNGSAPPSSTWLMRSGGVANPLLRGYNAANVGYALTGYDNGAGWHVATNISSRLQPNTDVLMMMKIGDEGRALVQKSPQGISVVDIVGTPIPGFTTNGRLAVMAVTSCGAGTDVVKATVQNGGLRFNLDNTYNQAALNGVLAPVLASPHTSDVFISPFEPVAYYVSSAANNPSTNLPTLERVTIGNTLPAATEAAWTGVWYQQTSQRIAAGVENLQFRYLVNGNYLTATQINALGSINEFWPFVSAVEVAMTLISTDARARSKNEAQTRADGTTVTDQRIRQELSFVVDVANR